MGNYIDLLQEVEIVEPVLNTSPQRYRVADSDVVEELFALNHQVGFIPRLLASAFRLEPEHLGSQEGGGIRLESV